MLSYISPFQSAKSLYTENNNRHGKWRSDRPIVYNTKLVCDFDEALSSKITLILAARQGLLTLQH